MSVIPQQPLNPIAFNTGLCDCFNDFNSVLDTYCCTYCIIAREYNMVANGVRDFNCMCCFGMFLCGGLGLLAGSFLTRTKAVERLMIQEDGCTVCLYSVFCLGCSTCQIYRELSMRGMWPGGSCCITAPYYNPQFIAPPTVMQMVPANGLPQQYAVQQPQPYPVQPPQYPVQPQPYSGQPQATEPFAPSGQHPQNKPL
jgi:Cys-rich protein (TIGR01571 family)